MSEIPKVGQIFDARYKIEEVLGTGGYGTVYKAQQLDCNRTVALKVLHGAIADEIDRARFVREAQTLSKLSHANVVTVYHLGVSANDLSYLAMEYVKGSSLREIMKTRVPVNRSLKLVRDVAQTMDYVHQCNVVHRDLKPENILVLQSPAPDTIKLLDFGLVRLIEPEAADQKLTNTGYMMGSISYMSPEQCLGKKVDFRTDIYSLTVILYEMIRGKLPFEADNPVGMAYKHINEDVPELAMQDVDIFHPHLNTLIAQGTAKDPDKRFASMAAMVEELDSVTELCATAGVAHKPKRKLPYFVWPFGFATAAGLLYLAGWHPGSPDSLKTNSTATAERAQNKRRLASLERTYGPDSPELAKELKSIGDKLLTEPSMSNSEEGKAAARAFYERALVICRKSLPKGTLLTTRVLYQIGLTYDKQPAKAIPYLEEALATESDITTVKDKNAIRSSLVMFYLDDKQLDKGVSEYCALLKDPNLANQPCDFQLATRVMKTLYGLGRSNEAHAVFLNAIKDKKWQPEKLDLVYQLVIEEKEKLPDALVQESVSCTKGVSSGSQESKWRPEQLQAIGELLSNGKDKLPDALVQEALGHIKEVNSGDQDIQWLTRFSQVYRRLRQPLKAAPLIDEAVVRCNARNLPQSNIHLYATYDLRAHYSLEQGKLADAEKYLRKVIECHNAFMKAEKRSQEPYRYTELAAVLDAQNKYLDADEVIKYGISSMEKDEYTPQEVRQVMHQCLAQRLGSREDKKGQKQAELLQSVNLVTNGSFEVCQKPATYSVVKAAEAGLKGWSVLKNSVDIVSNDFWPAIGSQMCIDLDGTPGPGGISQTINTVPGQKYRLTFKVSGNANAGERDKTFNLSVSGKCLPCEIDSAKFNVGKKPVWQTRSQEFIATDPQTTITFLSTMPTGSECGAVLDEIEVVAVPKVARR